MEGGPSGMKTAVEEFENELAAHMPYILYTYSVLQACVEHRKAGLKVKEASWRLSLDVLLSRFFQARPEESDMTSIKGSESGGNKTSPGVRRWFS